MFHFLCSKKESCWFCSSNTFSGIFVIHRESLMIQREIVNFKRMNIFWHFVFWSLVKSWLALLLHHSIQWLMFMWTIIWLTKQNHHFTWVFFQQFLFLVENKHKIRLRNLFQISNRFALLLITIQDFQEKSNSSLNSEYFRRGRESSYRTYLVSNCYRFVIQYVCICASFWICIKCSCHTVICDDFWWYLRYFINEHLTH